MNWSFMPVAVIALCISLPVRIGQAATGRIERQLIRAASLDSGSACTGQNDWLLTRGVLNRFSAARKSLPGLIRKRASLDCNGEGVSGTVLLFQAYFDIETGADSALAEELMANRKTCGLLRSVAAYELTSNQGKSALPKFIRVIEREPSALAFLSTEIRRLACHDPIMLRVRDFARVARKNIRREDRALLEMHLHENEACTP